MTKQVKFALVAAVTVILSSAATAQPPAEVQRGGQMISGNSDAILKFAYPTAKRLNQLADGRYEKFTDGSFRISYNFGYIDSDGDSAYVKLMFSFNATGKLTGIRELERSSVWPAFGTADLMLGLFKEGIRNDPKLKDDPNWRQLLNVQQSNQFLIGMMNLKNGYLP